MNRRGPPAVLRKLQHRLPHELLRIGRIVGFSFWKFPGLPHTSRELIVEPFEHKLTHFVNTSFIDRDFVTYGSLGIIELGFGFYDGFHTTTCSIEPPE